MKTQSAGDPTATVQAFYRAVSSHQFGAAASLWSAALKATEPPVVFIDQRFATTQQIALTGSRVLSHQAATAVIYVDLVELVGGQQRHWVGTWQLVEGPSGWLLNSPDLRVA